MNAANQADDAHHINFRTGMIYGTAAAIIWGAWPVFSRLGVDQTLNAFDIAALRFGVAGLVLLPLIWRHALKGLGWQRALFLSFGAGVPYVLIMVGGLSLAPEGHAGVITPSVMLFCSTIGSCVYLGDKMTKARTIGMGAIIVGVGQIGWRAMAGNAGAVWLGDLMFAGGGMLWASYTVAARRWKVEPMHAVAIISVVSMALYLPVYFAAIEPRIFDAPLGEVLFQAGFQGVLTAIGALVFYTRSVAILGAGRGAIFAALVPAVTILLAMPVLGEHPTANEIVGVVAVSFGMAVAMGIVRLPVVRLASRSKPPAQP